MKFFLILTIFVVFAFANPNRVGRIFNGRNANVGEAPYMIQFRQIRVGETFAQHFCGGRKVNVYGIEIKS
jgi:secreted trypsin-like serine protease